MSEEKKQKKELTLEELSKKLKECEKLRDDYLAGWQRARADFLNYKKQEMERIEELINYSKEELILKILPVFDNLGRAETAIPEDLKKSEWLKGIIRIKNQFKNFLAQEHIEEIKARGQNFNPDLHEAVEQVEIKNKESGEIVEVLEKGYLINGQLLRPAKVRVTK